MRWCLGCQDAYVEGIWAFIREFRGDGRTMEFTAYQIIEQLIGPIMPIGESNTDKKRLENMGEHLSLIYALLKDVRLVANYKDRHEHSMRLAGKRAQEFLAELSEELAAKPNQSRI